MAVKLGKKQKGKAQAAEQKSAKKVKPVKKQESSEESSSEEEEMEVEQPVAPVKKTPAKKTPAKEAPAKKTAKKTPAKETPGKKKKAPPPVEEDSDDDSDEDDSDDDEEAPPAKKTKAGAKVVMTKQPEPEEDDEDDDDDEDDSDEDEDDSDEEEEAAPKKAPKPAQTKQAEIDDDDDDSEDDDDEDDDEDEDSEEEEEPTKVQQVKDAKKGGKKAQVAEEEDDDEEDSDEEDSDDEDDDDDDEDEEEEAPPMKKKKLAGGDAKTTKADNNEVEGEIISIFIGGVPKGTPDAAVEDFFTSQGVQVMNARVIPNKSFAYVDVTSEKTFKKAMELNHQELNGVEIRLERGKSRNENSKQNNAPTFSGGRDSSNATTLFVKGLNFDTTNDTLKEKFNCKEVRIPLKNGRPSGYAYMDFDTKEEVDNAMQTMQGAEVDGWNVILDYVGDKRKSGGQGSWGSEESQTLHIKGLTDGVTEEDLKEKLGALEVRRPTRRDDPSSKVDFAYADFPSLDAAKQAYAEYQGASVKDAVLSLDYAKSRRQSYGGRNEGELDKKTLYIKGLSWETTQERLQSTLGADSVRIPYDRTTNQPKGFAYAEYSSESEASTAFEKFNGTNLDGYTMTMDYAKQRTSFGSPRGGRGNFGGGFRGGRGGGGFGGGRGGRGGRGGGFRGGRGGRGGGFRGGRGGQGGGFGEYKGKKTSFDD